MQRWSWQLSEVAGIARRAAAAWRGAQKLRRGANLGARASCPQLHECERPAGETPALPGLPSWHCVSGDLSQCLLAFLATLSFVPMMKLPGFIAWLCAPLRSTASTRMRAALVGKFGTRQLKLLALPGTPFITSCQVRPPSSDN